MSLQTVAAVHLIEQITDRDFSVLIDFYTSALRYDGVKIPLLNENKKSITFDMKGKSENQKNDSRRKREVGFFWRFLAWAFSLGGSESNEDLPKDKSAGLIIHTVDAVKKVEGKILYHENLLEKEFERLSEEVGYQRKRGFYQDINAVEAQIHRASDAILQHIERIVEVYTNHPILDEELFKILKGVNTQVLIKGAKLPEISFVQLKELCIIEMEYRDQITFLVTIPLISLTHFQRMLVTPFPDLATRSIGNFSEKDVIINIKQKQFFDFHEIREVTRINQSIIMVDAPIIHRLTEDSNCVYGVILSSEKTCPMVPLPAEFNYWMITPLHNMVQFASTKKKILICPTNRSLINDQFGVISIPPGCYVQTDSDIIRSTLDEKKSVNVMAKISFENITSLLVFPTPPSVDENIKNNISLEE